MAEELYKLIDGELARAESEEDDLATVYPKLVVCYEFYRYIRGEYFLGIRPYGTPCQKQMYQSEDLIGKRLRKLREKLDINDPSVKYNLDLGRKLFD